MDFTFSLKSALQNEALVCQSWHLANFLWNFVVFNDCRPKVEDDDVSSLQPCIISGIRSDSQCAFEKFQRPICIKGRKGKRNLGECLCAYWRFLIFVV